MNKPVRIARHVYLRTQQRRLRHVKGVLIRNLTLPSHAYLTDPLSISVYFTVHHHLNPERVLFTSDAVQDSYNPSWESIQLTGHGIGHQQSFLLRVRVKLREDDFEGRSGTEEFLVFEKNVELFDLSYLGLMVNKDGSSYPPNSVVVSMYEGLYSHPEVGGVPCAPRVVHTLTDYLPPQSLLEVPKKEVVDSYLQPVLHKIIRHQELLNKTRRWTQQERAKVEHCLRLEREATEKRNERERLRTRLKLYKAQLKEMEEPEKEESSQLERVTSQVDEAERALRERQADLRHKQENLLSAMSVFTHKREQMQRLKRNRHLRQRHMVYELASTFLIRERDDTFTICNVILPNADQLEQPSRVEQLGVALGYVAHLIHHLGKILFLPLLYPIRPQGSKSVILDLVSEETLIDNIKEFPLFAKGSEKALFQYAVFLLNKDIAQVRQHCGYGTSKTMFKRTLPNLKFLLDRLTRDIKAMMRGNNRGAGFHTPHPHDTMSMSSSYISLDANSMVSGSVATDSLPSPEADSLSSFSTLGSQPSSMLPSMFTQTQQFLQRDSNYSLRSIASAGPDDDSHSHSIHSDIEDHPISPSNLTRKSTDSEETDIGDDKNAVPLSDLATKHTFLQPLRGESGEEGEDSQLLFSTLQKVTRQSCDEEEEEEEEDSNTSSVASLSTTPVAPDIPEEVYETENTLQSSSAALSRDETRRETSNDSSTVELGSSAVSRHLEDTLKSAVHVTQLLLGQHTPPEQVQIKPVPTITGTNEAEIESAHALRGLTAASFAGQTALGIRPPPEETTNNGEQEREEDSAPPQGPPTFPDALELPSRSGRAGEISSDNGQSFSTSPEWPRPRSMAQSGFAMENVGYVKTGMATPHRVGGGGLGERREERRERYTIMSSGRSPDNQNGESLADFIDRPSDAVNSAQNRLKQRGPGLLGPRGAF